MLTWEQSRDIVTAIQSAIFNIPTPRVTVQWHWFCDCDRQSTQRHCSHSWTSQHLQWHALVPVHVLIGCWDVHALSWVELSHHIKDEVQWRRERQTCVWTSHNVLLTLRHALLHWNKEIVASRLRTHLRCTTHDKYRPTCTCWSLLLSKIWLESRQIRLPYFVAATHDAT